MNFSVYKDFREERTQFDFVENFVQYAIKIYFCTWFCMCFGTNLKLFKAKCQIVVNELRQHKYLVVVTVYGAIKIHVSLNGHVAAINSVL